MNPIYGSPGYGSPGAYAPPRKINFNWIGASFTLFGQNVGIWIVAMLAMVLLPAIIGGIVGGIYGASTAMSSMQHQTPPFGSPAPPFGANNPPFGATPGTAPSFGINRITGGLPIPIYLGLQLASIIWTMFMYGGLYRMAVNQVRGLPISFGDIFSGAPVFWRMLGFYIIYSLAVGLGLVLFILPGLLVAVLLMPGYALIADGETIGGAISRASDGMKKDLWNGVLFVIVVFLMMLVSAIPCGLGLLVTLPMFFLIAALAYRDMVGMPNMAAPGGPGYGATGYASPQPGVWPPPPGQAAPPQWGQTPPQWGQTPQNQPPGQGGGQTPPRTTLSGDPIDNP